MADKKDEESAFWKLAGHSWEIVEFVSVLSMGAAALGKFVGWNVPKVEVDKEKGELNIGGKSREGGDDTFDDERYMQELVDALEEEERQFFLGWKAYEFPVTSESLVTRARARKAMGNFRQMVCGMDHDPAKVGKKTTVSKDGEDTITTVLDVYSNPEQKALKYLKRLAGRIKVAYEEELKDLDGREPTKRERNTRLKRAYAKISEDNRQRAVPHMPTKEEKDFFDRLKSVWGWAKEKTKPATDKVKKEAPGVWDYAKTNGKRLGEAGLHEVKETAVAADTALANHADELRQSREAYRSPRQAYKKNRDEGHDRAFSAGKATKDTVNSRRGPRKRRTYRVAALLNPLGRR